MATDGLLSLGFAAADWMEHYLVHGPGDVQGMPIELDVEFYDFIVEAYKVDAVGDRVVRRAFLSRAKGRSKSGLAAMIACFEALGPCRFDHFAEPGEISDWGYEYEPGEPVGRPLVYVEILNVATEEGQAGNTYDAIHYMLNPETCARALVADYGKIDVGLTRTNLPDRRGFIEPVTSADSSKDGGKSTFIVADETHLWVLPRLKRLHGVMTRNLLKRKLASGWMLETSTMYSEGDGSVAEGTHTYAKSVRSGSKKDRTLLFDHRQASEQWDLSKRTDRMKALREAYGPAAAWMNLDAICDSWDDPQVSEAEFRRYWLNQPVSTAPKRETVFGAGAWEQLTDPASSVEKMAAFAVEVDLERVRSSVGAAGIRDDGKVHIEVVHPGPDRALELGLLWPLRGTGWVVPWCQYLNRNHGRAQFVVDGGGPAAVLVTAMQAAGLDVLVIGTAEVAQASAEIVDAVNDERVVHGPQSELDSAVEGAQKRPFRDGGFAFGRLKSGVDITPLMAVTLAHWRARQPPKEPPEAYSLADYAEQIKRERAESAPVNPNARPDGSVFNTF